MEITLADQYYLKAAVSYPWNIAEALEQLNYALSYDDEHAQSWCLQGMIHMYSLKNYDSAQTAFNMALRSDLNYVDTYKHLTLLEIWKGDIKKARKLIDYAFQVEVMEKSTILGLEAMVFEIQGRFKDAERILETARLISISCDTMSWLNKISKRIKTKKKNCKKLAKQSKRKSGNPS